MNALIPLFVHFDPIKEDNADMQAQLLSLCLSNFPIPYRTRISRGHCTRRICEWDGDPRKVRFTCNGSVLVRMKFASAECGNILLDAIPPTVINLIIHNCDQNATLATRALPRDAEVIYLSNNLYFGQVDFAHLPEKLLRLDLARNALSGSVVLRSLPERIFLINLSHNAFNTKTTENSQRACERYWSLTSRFIGHGR